MTDTQQPECLPPTTVSTATTEGMIGNAVLSVSTSSSSQHLQQQMSKLRDANNKYKSLLKLAKERIQGQEEEIEALKVQLSSTNKLVQELVSQQSDDDLKRKSLFLPKEEDYVPTPHHHLLRVCQRIRVESSDNDEDDDCEEESGDKPIYQDNSSYHEGTSTDRLPSDTREEPRRYAIWALLQYEYQPPEDAVIATTVSNSKNNAMSNHSNMGQTKKRWKKWKKFMSESELSDFIFRVTGEPIVLPHYSLTPEQSFNVEQTAKAAVAQITEDFRRYRVRAEVQRKQADATIKALQGATLHTVQQKIEGWHHQQQQGSISKIMASDTTANTSSTATTHSTTNMIQWKKELKEQEAQWREAYDALLQENNILKSAGGEALLASQWRHRFEAAERDKQEYAIKVEAMEQQLREISASNKYESKYRDLKESFRLYRKKAKEIFEAQQQQQQHPEYGGGGAFSIGGGDEAKIAYLRNLMVNYLSSDASMRDPMEVAIKTVLQFTPDDVARIEKAKKANEAWF